MKTTTFVGIALAGLIATATTAAQAAYVADGTLDRMFNLHNTYGANWVDRVGGSQFELFGVNVASSTDNGGTMTLSLFTNYGLKTESQFHTRTADIAFKLQGDSDFNFGLILFDHGTTARKDDNSLQAGFYAVDSWLTSEDIFGDLGSVAYGGRAAVCTDNASCDAADQRAINTYLDSGTLLVANGGSANGFTLNISVVEDATTPDNLFTAEYRIDITMTGIGALFGPAWEMEWGNAICANDTIFVSGVGIPQQVPEPASLGLLAAGIIGFGAARRVRSKT